jgi:endonuclease YncB( thermonuclease family)
LDWWSRISVEVGRIYLGERFINAEMVRDGFAWRYPVVGY